MEVKTEILTRPFGRAGIVNTDRVRSIYGEPDRVVEPAPCRNAGTSAYRPVCASRTARMLSSLCMTVQNSVRSPDRSSIDLSDKEARRSVASTSLRRRASRVGFVGRTVEVPGSGVSDEIEDGSVEDTNGFEGGDVGLRGHDSSVKFYHDPNFSGHAFSSSA